MTQDNSSHAIAAEDRDLLSRFIEEARRKVHLDYKKAPSQLRAFFLYIEREMFNPGFTITAARKAANLKSNNYTTRFSKVTGRRPKEYVDHHRISVARKIVKYTNLYYWQAGFAVGYMEPTVFSRNYRRVLGYPPNKELKADLNGASRRSIQNTKIRSSASTKALDPRAAANTAEVSTDCSSDLNLDKFWGDVQDMTRLDIKTYILAHMEDVGIEHYRYLLEKARHKVRFDKIKGKQLCLAALDTLRLVEFKEEKEFSDEKAIGYASLANICKLELRFDEARKWFQVADAFLPADSSDKPLLFAQISFLRASLFWWQRNTEAAISLLDQTLPDIRRHGSYAFLARVLLLKAEIYECSGYGERALPLFVEAVELAEFILDDSYVVFSAHFNLTFCYTKMSMPTEATAQFEKVKELIKIVEGGVSPFFVLHLEGSVSRLNRNLKMAESLFLEAKEGFLSQGLDIFAALVSLELSLVYLEQRETGKALLAAVSAIPSISRHSVHREAIAALAILEEAKRLESIDEAVIRQVLNKLDLVRKDPVGDLGASIPG